TVSSDDRRTFGSSPANSTRAAGSAIGQLANYLRALDKRACHETLTPQAVSCDALTRIALSQFPPSRPPANTANAERCEWSNLEHSRNYRPESSPQVILVCEINGRVRYHGIRDRKVDQHIGETGTLRRFNS